MLETMYVRCTHCGYDNSPEYRFCGMCGASLAHLPVPTTKPKEAAPPENGGKDHGNPENVHGPSFLGLAEDPKTEFHYLYEDEPPRSHAGLIFVVFLLLALGAAGYWQYSHNGFPFNRLSSASGNTPSASPSEVAPAQNQDQQTHAEKPMTGAGEVLPTAPDQKSQTASPGTVVDLPAQGTPAANPSAPPSNSESGSNASGDTGSAAPTESHGAEPTEEAKATPPAVPEKPTKAKPKAKAPKPAAPAAAAPTSPDADLELAGERYLYGNGLPQNCTRAEFNLRTAATHGNSKAQTVLGTMYATGHCVGRDLPTAYRWFARALHQEPNNSRISADLQVLWRQMTPQEKQLATTGGQ
jgi:hypothetical protein